MTNILRLQAQPDAPIVCDMSTAEDTPDERLREYGQLFERALLRRERRADSLVFSFRATPGTRRAVEGLARREAACCPFLDYRVETLDDEVIYTITNTGSGEGRASVDVMFDALYALPDHAGSDFAGLLGRLADDGVHVIESPANSERFEWHDGAAGRVAQT
jgi:hypothetical protein